MFMGSVLETGSKDVFVGDSAGLPQRPQGAFPGEKAETEKIAGRSEPGARGRPVQGFNGA
jgi:hypothetical protein